MVKNVKLERSLYRFPHWKNCPTTKNELEIWRYKRLMIAKQPATITVPTEGTVLHIPLKRLVTGNLVSKAPQFSDTLQCSSCDNEQAAIIPMVI